MAYFHYRCGERITLTNENCTAIRNDSDFDHGLVITAEPLQNDVLFEIKIDRKVNSWSGSLEIGVVDCDSLHFEFPPCASKIQSGSWILSGSSIYINGVCFLEHYTADLDNLSEDDRIGLMKTSEGELMFYINGEYQGIAAQFLPNIVYGVVDLYGKCVQVTITYPLLREHNNDDCLSGSSVLAIDNDTLNVTLGGDLSELSLSSSNSLDIRMEMSISDRMRFHERCGSLIKLSNGNRTAERKRPLDEFNNGVVMTNRALKDGELFEIRIDRLIDKWSGSIEMGVTTHNPSALVFPATMTNMRTGTIMMSGCGILTNGKGTRREYGSFNLDELSEGDRVGMMRKVDGNLHFFVNGLDQGVAAQRVPSVMWGVIDLYGMTIKVSMVEREETEDQNLTTRRTALQSSTISSSDPPLAPSTGGDLYTRLTFHPNCGTHAQVIHNGRTAQRPNVVDDFNNAVVLTARPLRRGEMFEVRLERVVTKWVGSIEIGVTAHTPVDLEFPFTMTNVRSGTWMMTGSGVMHNGTIIMEQYGINLDRLNVGDKVGVLRKDNGCLHFYVNGIDQGAAATNVPELIFGVIDLYGQAVEASIVDSYEYNSPDTINSTISNTTLYSDLRFHHIHGKNARIIDNGLTALRPRALTEFNDAIIFSNRPLRDDELFEICVENVIDRWSGSIELGVTAVRPDDIELPSTATDLNRDTWMLSGSLIMENGKTLKNNYPCDLDTIDPGITLGVMRKSNKSLVFYRNGVPQGEACVVPYGPIYAVVDLYGQCTQVSIPCHSPVAPLASTAHDLCPRSDTSASLQVTNAQQPQMEPDYHRFYNMVGKGITLNSLERLATRTKNFSSGIVYSANPLTLDELFEISIIQLSPHLAGTICVGVTEMLPTNSGNMPADACYITGNELRFKNRLQQYFVPSLNWLNIGDNIGIIKTKDSIKILLNGEELPLMVPHLPENLYVIVNLRGTCSAVSIISHKAPNSLNASIKMLESTDLTIDNEMLSVEMFEFKIDDVGLPSKSNENVIYEFSENHGRNIEIFNAKSSAKRVASYNQGVVLVQPCLELEANVKIEIINIDTQWESSLIVGLVCGPPEKINLSVNALSLKTPCCVVSNDWILVNGTKSKLNYGESLNNLNIGDVVSITLTSDGCFKLSINDMEQENLPCSFPQNVPIHAVFDLYGQCQEIKLLNKIPISEQHEQPKSTEGEKADLESCEKERITDSLTLPIPSISANDSAPVTVKSSPVSPLKTMTCLYREEVEKIKKRMLLPDNYFAQEDAICFCPNCFKLKNQQGEKDDGLIGWVKFPLLNSTVNNIQTEKWHLTHYPTKLGNVRCILDKGQPLTKEQSQWGPIVPQKEDDVQVIFYPSLQNCLTPRHKFCNKIVKSAFQLLVKPGAYSISREPLEWSTKETGAIVLHALLLQLVSE